MVSALTKKLSGFADLSNDDRALLDRICDSARPVAAGRDLIKEGEQPGDVFFLAEGWACRYKVLANGSKHIMAYLLPGDLCDIHVFLLKKMDHSIRVINNARVAIASKSFILEVLAERPAIAQALLWAQLVGEATLREWLVNLSQRDAYERIAHLFCELAFRMEAIGLNKDNSFSLPLTQDQLSDSLGMTSVHVNRTLQRMRVDRLISLSDKRLTIHNITKLWEIAEFDPNYLHLDRKKN